MSSGLRYCPTCAGDLETRDLGDQGSHPVCLTCGNVLWQNLKTCVDALIVRATDNGPEILLGRRCAEPGKGSWDVPGNFLNVGDTPESRLKLACQSEMGIGVDVREIVGAFSDQFGDIATLTLYYVCNMSSGSPRPGVIIDEARWFPLSDAPSLAFPGLEQAISALRVRLGQGSS